MRSTPDLILDTNVCGKLVAPQSFIELVNAMRGGDGTHFAPDQQRLRLLAGNRSVKFLPFPVAFTLRKVLGIDPPLPGFFGPSDFRFWFSIVIHAESRAELLSGDVRLPSDSQRQRRGFDLDTMNRQLEDGIAQHRAEMEKAIGGKGALPAPGPWAAGLAASLGCTLNAEQATRLASGLDAAHRYAIELSSVVANGKYNFENHRGDWFDWQQLFYLCDPGVFLLTDDVGIRTRVGSSPQSSRILYFRDFLKEHGFISAAAGSPGLDPILNGSHFGYGNGRGPLQRRLLHWSLVGGLWRTRR